jgi:hypothetical protein
MLPVASPHFCRPETVEGPFSIFYFPRFRLQLTGYRLAGTTIELCHPDLPVARLSTDRV